MSKPTQQESREQGELRGELKKKLIQMLNDAKEDGLADHILDGYIDEEIMPLFTASNQAAELRGIETAIKAYESTCECLIQAAVKKERERILYSMRLSHFKESNSSHYWLSPLEWQALQQPQEKE